MTPETEAQFIEAVRRHIASYEAGTLVGSELNLACALRDIDGEKWEPWCVPGSGEDIPPLPHTDPAIVGMIEAAGCCVVPLEPTEAMIRTGMAAEQFVTSIYHAMLAARPRP